MKRAVLGLVLGGLGGSGLVRVSGNGGKRGFPRMVWGVQV